MIDLHTHSTVSDGTDTPRELVALAARVPLTALAITDHDTLDHIPEATAAADEHGLRLVPACELSCAVPPEVGGVRRERRSARRSPPERERREPWAEMHLLVYFPEPDGPIAPRLRELQAARVRRNERIVERLRDAGIDLSIDEVLQEAGAGAVGRPHVGAVLVRKGVVASIDEAFERWLAKGRPGYVERERLVAAEAIDLAHESGAVTSLAHPGSLGLDGEDLDDFVGSLTAVGLDALECEYGRYAPAERAAYRDVALRHGLVATGGSDYHGAYKPDLRVGVGRGDLAVSEDALDELERRRR